MPTSVWLYIINKFLGAACTFHTNIFRIETSEQFIKSLCIIEPVVDGAMISTTTEQIIFEFNFDGVDVALVQLAQSGAGFPSHLGEQPVADFLGVVGPKLVVWVRREDAPLFTLSEAH
jgi:hypothetical protein